MCILLRFEYAKFGFSKVIEEKPLGVGVALGTELEKLSTEKNLKLGTEKNLNIGVSILFFCKFRRNKCLTQTRGIFHLETGLT